jgi:general stress protein YciG
MRDDELARVPGRFGFVEHEPGDCGPGCAVREEPAAGGRQGQGAGAGIVSLVGEGAGMQHGAPGAEHYGVGGDLVLVFGAEAGAEETRGEAAHRTGRAAGADRAEPHDAARAGGDHSPGACGEGACLFLARDTEAGDDHGLRSNDGGDGSRVVHIPAVDAQARIRWQCRVAGIADNRVDLVASFESLVDEVTAGAAGGTEDSDPHSVHLVQGLDHRCVHTGGSHQHGA